MANIFIEGLPCAGKSLLVKQLESHGCFVVHELGRVIDKESFPGDGDTIEKIIEIDEWFIHQEARRFVEAELVFYDRSYLTHLVYAYAYSKYKKLPSFINTVMRYRKAIIEEYILPIPEVVIYVSIDPTSSIARQRGKMAVDPSKALASFWRNSTFLEDTFYAYNTLFDTFSGIKLLILDAENDTNSKYETVKNFLSDYAPKISRSIDIDRYIEALTSR